MNRRIASPRRRPLIVQVEQNGEYLSVEIEIDRQIRIGKYMRYGWDHAPWSAQQEVERLLKGPGK